MSLIKIKPSLTSAKQNANHSNDNKSIATTNYTNQDTAKCYNNRNKILAVYLIDTVLNSIIRLVPLSKSRAKSPLRGQNVNYFNRMIKKVGKNISQVKN